MADHDDHYLLHGRNRNKALSIQNTSVKNRSQRMTSQPPDKRNLSDDQKNVTDDFFQLPIRDLLTNSNAGIFITDEQDNLIWANEVILKYSSFAFEMDIILNRHALQAVHYMQEFVIHPRWFKKRIKELLNNRKIFFSEEIPIKDGRTMRLDYYPVFHESRFYGAIWQVTDCTSNVDNRQSQVHQSDNSFKEMLDLFHIAYAEINMEGDIINISPFFCKFTGYSEDELMKTNLMNLCLSGKQQLINSLKSQRSGLLTKTTFSFELEIVLRNGLRKWMQCHVSCKINSLESQQGAMLLLTEITEQKSIQQELEDAKKIAERAQVAQQQFLASMSHDIRTPLNAIIGMTFLMEDTSLNVEQHEYVKVLKNASNILLGLLNGVLDFAKIEAGRQEVHQREFDLPRLLKSLVETFSFKLNEKPVKLYCEIDSRIDHVLMGDDILLNQILMNLLSNAEKFTAKGEINLKVSVVKEYDNNIWIEFKVEDTGIGISKEKLKEIFQDFIQANEDIRINYGGSGLGLFICKKLVEMLGGQISVESTQGRGTSFIFSLPFVLTNQLLKKEERQIASSHVFHTEDVRVLVVEDNPMNLKYLSSLLNKYQIPFDVATDGKKALKKASEQYYNLILMDMKLPKMSGMDVAAYIRQGQSFNTATPIVLVSAAAFQTTVDRAKEVGVNELLAKPYTPDQLIYILRKYLIDEDDEREEAIAASLDENSFKFDERLDTAYLHKLYAGNCAYALSLFEVFLECMEKDWQEIQKAVEDKDWQQLKNLVHKVKPNFSMVGLTWITAMMQDVYGKLKQGSDETAVPLLEEVQKEFDLYLPLVKAEFARMQQFVEQEVS